MQSTFLANYEQLVLRVARVVLTLLATCAFFAILTVLVWLTIRWIKPSANTYTEFMYVPAYESLNSEWKSPQINESSTTTVKLPPVFEETVEAVDSLYQLVGRSEQKFSEKEDLHEVLMLLREPFEDLDNSEDYITEFLIELKLYAEQMVGDQLLRRIADVEMRTSTILNSIYQFRDDYHTNLLAALTSVERRMAEDRQDRLLTSVLSLQMLSIFVTTFVISTVCLLGFHAVSKRHETSSSITQSNKHYE